VKCPKCGHEQAPTVECQRCGVIIAKARKAAARRAKATASAGPTPKTAPAQRNKATVAHSKTQSTVVKSRQSTHTTPSGSENGGPSSAERDGNSTNVHSGTKALAGSLKWLRGGGSLRHRVLFYREMAQLLKAAVPMDESLATVERIVRRGKLGPVVADMRAAVAAGQTIHGAMKRHRQTFDHVELTLVEAAYQTGELAEVFERLAERLHATGAVKSQLLSSLVYPALVAFSACILLPVPTFVTESPSAFVGHVVVNLAVYVALVVAVLVGLPRLWAHPSARDTLLRIGAMVPGLGRLVRARRFSLVYGTLAAGISAGMPLPSAIELAGRASGESSVEDASAAAITALQSGSGFADAIATMPGTDDETIGLLASGERSGHIDVATQRQADRFETRYRQGVKVLAQVTKFGFSFLVAMVIATAVAGQFAKMLGDPMSMMPAGQRQDLERELNRAQPQLQK